jgi:hypothetical protein
MTEYQRVTITEAREGDELLQAGEWVAIASATPMRHSTSVVVRWADGGSHSAPAHFFGPVRRAITEAPSQAESLARVTGSVAATVRTERRNADGSLTVVASETYTREANRPHDFETEGRQSERVITTCAVCGLSRNAAVHA